MQFEAVAVRMGRPFDYVGAWDHGIVVLDFEGVDTVSKSFADELFGELVARLGSDKVRLTHLSPHLAAVAKLAQLARKPAASHG